MTTATETPWQTQATCRTRGDNGELWFSDTPTDRALALHLCLTHRPVLQQCETARITRSHGIFAGTAYAANGQPDERQTKPSSLNCPHCLQQRAQATVTSVWADCGRPATYRRHLDRNEVPCTACCDSRRNRPAPPTPTEVAKRRATRAAAKEAAVEQIRTWAGEGHSDREIAAALKWSVQRVWAARKDNNIPPGRAPLVTTDTEEQIQKVRVLAGQGHTDTEITAAMGWSPKKAYRVRTRYQIAAGVRAGHWRADATGRRVTEVAA